MPLALLFILLLSVPAQAENAAFAEPLDAFTQPYEAAGHLSGVLLVARGDLDPGAAIGTLIPGFRGPMNCSSSTC